MSERKYFFLGQKKIVLIYSSYILSEREIVFHFFFLGKQPIKNKSYFYKSFPLIKDSFPLTNLFLCYQTLENVKNYFYRRFSNEINRALS